MKTATYTNAARKDLRRLPDQIRDRIKRKLAALATGESADVTQLTGQPGARLRVGDYRVVFIDRDETIEVRAVGHRREIYR